VTDKETSHLLRKLADELDRHEALIDVTHKPATYTDNFTIHAVIPKGVK
jgi:hypothetical protein